MVAKIAHLSNTSSLRQLSHLQSWMIWYACHLQRTPKKWCFSGRGWGTWERWLGMLNRCHSTDYSGRMLLMNTVRTKPCTIGLSGGANSVCSIKFLLSRQIRRLLIASLMLSPPTSRLTAQRQVCSKRAFSTSHRSNERRPKFQTPYRLCRA